MRVPGAARRRLARILARLAVACGMARPAQEASLSGRGPGDAGVRVVGADVDGDQGHPAAVRAQEPDRGGELRARRIGADAAVDHGGGGLAVAAELDQPQAGVARPQRRVELVGVAVRGIDAEPGGIRLDALRQGVAEGQVVAGRRCGVARLRGRGSPGGTAGHRGGQEPGQGRDSPDSAHHSPSRSESSFYEPVRRTCPGFPGAQPGPAQQARLGSRAVGQRPCTRDNAEVIEDLEGPSQMPGGGGR